MARYSTVQYHVVVMELLTAFNVISVLVDCWSFKSSRDSRCGADSPRQVLPGARELPAGPPRHHLRAEDVRGHHTPCMLY